MQQYTKQLIVEKTLELAETKPLGKLTVKEITEASGITRNAFYYHFHDMYEVFDYLFGSWIDTLLDEADNDAEKALFAIMELCINNKKVLINLYKTLGTDELERLMDDKLERLIVLTVNREMQELALAPLDLQIIMTFYKKAVFGIMIEWLRGRMREHPEDIRETLDRIRVIFTGQLELMIRNCSAGAEAPAQ
ncbi:MAG: TetR/AcrR family transcriptional regulator [Ruminococcus sp.]|nr:TetR/AcrR family transcriptional regulator [Ruminococcus sp.]